MKYWLPTLAMVAACLIALRFIPTELSPGLVSAPEIESYQHGLERACRAAAPGRGVAVPDVAGFCACQLQTLKRQLARADWQQAAYAARKGLSAEEARLMAPLAAQLERCRITTAPAWAGAEAQAGAADLGFQQARARSDAQPPGLAYPYEDAWFAFNNLHHIDERGACYGRSSAATRQVLVLDRSGRVAAVIADIDNAKSQCFRLTYLNEQFPAPPFAPYYLYLPTD